MYGLNDDVIAPLNREVSTLKKQVARLKRQRNKLLWLTDGNGPKANAHDVIQRIKEEIKKHE